MRHYWELENKAESASGDSYPWPPVILRLWDDVPAKPPPKGQGKGGSKLTPNPLDNLFGLIALHTGEFRHWAYHKVWWSEYPEPMPASGGRAVPLEFGIPAGSEKWISQSVYINHAESVRRRSGKHVAPDLDRMENTLLAPATSGGTHFRAMHLVLGLAELFVQYATEATARGIYEAVLTNDIIIRKRSRQRRPL